MLGDGDVENKITIFFVIQLCSISKNVFFSPLFRHFNFQQLDIVHCHKEVYMRILFIIFGRTSTCKQTFQTCYTIIRLVQSTLFITTLDTTTKYVIMII